MIHMNGRVFDPVIARFVTPDPRVPNIEWLQDHNRFAYVLGNPFSYTDPTGFSAYNDLSNPAASAKGDSRDSNYISSWFGVAAGAVAATPPATQAGKAAEWVAGVIGELHAPEQVLHNHLNDYFNNPQLTKGEVQLWESLKSKGVLSPELKAQVDKMTLEHDPEERSNRLATPDRQTIRDMTEEESRYSPARALVDILFGIGKSMVFDALKAGQDKNLEVVKDKSKTEVRSREGVKSDGKEKGSEGKNLTLKTIKSLILKVTRSLMKNSAEFLGMLFAALKKGVDNFEKS